MPTKLLWDHSIGPIAVANVVTIGNGTSQTPGGRNGNLGLTPQGFLVGFVRADCNTDGLVNIADAISALCSLFGGFDLPFCVDACNANNDAGFDIGDPIYTLNFLFVDGSPPPDFPFPNCGTDGIDPLGCQDYPFCP